MCTSDRREFLRHSLLTAGAIGIAGFMPRAAVAQSADAVKDTVKYVCPPCGCAMDGTDFDKPGKCPACGMDLIVKTANARPQAVVAIFVFPGVQIIDFAAPYEVFGQAGYRVYTVARTKDSLLTNMNLKITPDYSFADMPQPHVLLVPGGDIGNLVVDRSEVLSWIRTASSKAKHTMSVCNGAFILAEAGLLNGKTATTNYGGMNDLRSNYPQVNVVTNRRFVDNGTISTTAGLSSGIDGALHIVSEISGAGAAQMVALNIEYDWKADGNYARASLADTHLHTIFGRRLKLDLPTGVLQEVTATQGDRQSWEAVWQVGSPGNVGSLTPQALADLIDSAVVDRGRWIKAGERVAEPGRQWKFVDAQSNHWTAQLQVDTVAVGGPLRARLSLRKVT